jgi:hypothetical protein
MIVELLTDDNSPQSVRAPLRRSRPVVLTLTALFSMDAFAGGLVGKGLLAGPVLARRIALVNTMASWMYGAPPV